MKHIRRKIREHQFLIRATFNDLHHLKNLKFGGQSIQSNLLLMNGYRHDALHFLFRDLDFNHIIWSIEKIDEVVLYNLILTDNLKRNAWKLLFKDLSLKEVVLLLKRVKRIKYY